MNPEDVIIPEVLTEGTTEEITDRARMMCQALQDIDPFLVELAIIFQNDQTQTNLDTFLALDAKRMELCDVFAAQLAIMRNLNIPRGDC